MITIVDYGIGNTGALENMLDFIGLDSCISSDPDKIAISDKLILPGVGSFDSAIKSITDTNILDALNYSVIDRKVFVLGICLGMQIFSCDSEEGSLKGLGWIDSHVKRLKPKNNFFKVPNFGWHEIKMNSSCKLFYSQPAGSRFYFSHSYYISCQNKANQIASIDYGGDVCCAVNKGNIFGVQFHPEKSHKYGMKLLENFGRL
jgi:glutamine amidotransferase